MRTRILGSCVCFTLAALGLAGEPNSKPANNEPALNFKRVKLRTKGRLVTFEELGHQARDLLKQKGIAPPVEVKPLFDLFPGQKRFLRVMFAQGIGKRSWYVFFDSEGQMLDAGSSIADG